MKDIYQIRRAEEKDIEEIAAAHIQSWYETYPGIMPEEKIAGLSMEGCKRNWINTFSSGYDIFVAVADNRVAGFVSGGKNRMQEDCETGLGNECECELAAIYLLLKYQKTGIGRALFNTFVAEMQKQDYESMAVWVAEKNPATGFYLAMGGKRIDRKILMLCNIPVPVIAYRFEI
jgi:GNAT superfamily N-acetyltransferase